MNTNRAHTIQLIRQLTAARPQRQRLGRIPAPLPLDPIDAEYFNALSRVCGLARDGFRSVEGQILDDLRDQRAAAGHTDATKKPPLESKRARELVSKAQRRFKDSVSSRDLNAIAERFGARTTEHNRLQLDRQLRAAIGVPYAAIEKPIRGQVAGWTRENVALIETVPARYFESIQGSVIDAYQAGTHPETLAKTFADRYDVSLSNARRIARDQIGKLNGALNKARQESLGVTTYIWRTVSDNRVRECHADLEGEVCEWDDPPMGGGTDETEPGHPGSGICCRCYSEPDLSQLIG